MGALSHIRVLDLSRILAGPWSTQILGDLGAEVIKIEKPDAGDDSRAWGPPWLKDDLGRDTSEAAYYASCNRNKKSVAIDVAQPEGRELILELAAKSDIFIENFKVGGLARYGLGYEDVKKINPNIIYCSITGFGQDGPYAERPGYDFLIQGMGGLMSLTGRPDGEPGAGPLKVGVALTDILTGMYSTVAILAALAHRDRTGEGQYIDLALLDVQVACLANQAMSYLASGKEPVRMGNAHPTVVPYQDFPTADGYMILAMGNDSQFAKFSEVAGHPEWAQDDRYRTNTARVANRASLLPMLQDATKTRTTDEWIKLLEVCSVPCGPINTLKTVFTDPQVVHREMHVRIPHPLAGQVSMVANPIHLSRTPVEYRNAPPTLGADTKNMLESVLGLDSFQIEKLKNSLVIGG